MEEEKIEVVESRDGALEAVSLDVRKDKSNFLGMSILASAIIVSGTLIYVFGPSGGVAGPAQNQNAGLPNTANLQGNGTPDISNSPKIGSDDAPVTIVEYSDFECPFCARFFNETLSSIESDYISTGRVRFVYKDYPLTSIHFEAQKASEAARCVRDELGDEGFWAMHDMLFERQGSLSVSNYKVWAREIGANGSKFDTCLDSDKFADEVQADVEEGLSLGVTGTPTFFVNGTKVVGAVPYAQLASVIEAELAKAE